MKNKIRKFLSNNYFGLIISLISYGFFSISISRFGLGVSPDSTNYLSGATMISGGNFLENWHALWPPIYPIAIFFMANLFNISSIEGAEILNKILVPLVIFVFWMILNEIRNIDRFTIFLNVLILATLSPIYFVAIYVWSELLFIFLSLLGFYSLVLYQKSKNLKYFWFAIIFISLSSLTRYIGIIFVIPLLLEYLKISHDLSKKTFIKLLGFLFVTISPFSIWLIRNYLYTNTFLGVREHPGFPVKENIYRLLSSIYYLWLPDKFVEGRILEISLILCIVAVLIALLNIYFWKNDKSHRDILLLCGLFVVTYCSFLVWSATTTLFDAISIRFIAPIFPYLIILIVLIISTFPSNGLNINIAKLARLIFLSYILIIPARETYSLLREHFSNGTGFNSKNYLNSEMINNEFENYKQNGVLYSNSCDYLIFKSTQQLDCIPIPTIGYNLEFVDRKLLLSNFELDYFAENSQIVYFSNISKDYLISVEELQEHFGLKCIKEYSDGVICNNY